MAFLIDEAFLPATLTAHPMTDEEFAAFCAEHPDLFFEMTAEGELIVMPPTYTFTCAQNLEILGQLRISGLVWMPAGRRPDPRADSCSQTERGDLPTPRGR